MEGKFKSKDAKARNRAGIFPGLRDNRLPHTVSILQIILRCPVPQKIPPQTVTVYAEAFVLLRIFFYFAFSLSTSAKCSLVSLITTGESANNAMKFGIAIRPLKVSAISHTASIGLTQPTTMMMQKKI